MLTGIEHISYRLMEFKFTSFNANIHAWLLMCLIISII